MPAIVSDAAVNECMLCYHFGLTNPNDPAPSLSNLLNRQIASDVFRYSPGFRAKRGTWTKALLVEFLSDPAKFANGTNMPSLPLTPEEIQDIADKLVRASSSVPLPASRTCIAMMFFELLHDHGLFNACTRIEFQRVSIAQMTAGLLGDKCRPHSIRPGH